MFNSKWTAGMILVVGAAVLTGCKTNQPVEVVQSPRYESQPLSEPVDLDLPELAQPAALGDQYADAGGLDSQAGLPAPAPSAAPAVEDQPASAPQTPPAAAAPAAGERVHVVQRGETLWSIAVRHYSDGQMWQQIAAANSLGDGNKIREGQKLVLP